jgi:glycosyltransferase involved in cell wall biosynthesis
VVAVPSAPDTTAGPAPIVLFLPAFNEEASVGGVVRRVPAQILGHPVECLVVDDGSADRTPVVAVDAGARVITLLRNRGLGAAVRTGLAHGVHRGAAAIAFCDADGEYAPEQLAELVSPILRGDADYVVGSRFCGRIEHMQRRRRAGNRVLTWALGRVAGHPISDGQSGYRALSPAAAAAAEIAHDYNYAQVLTLDLLAKGFRYHEVPISYRFRETGRSFVRLTTYLRSVVPTVWKQVRAGRRAVSRAVPPLAQSSTTCEAKVLRAVDQRAASS